MLIVKALNKIYKGSKCIGWKMMDFNGNIMDATTESIKQAILNGSVNAINLTIANNGELVMINGEVKTHNETTPKIKCSAPSYLGIQIKNLKKYIGREGEAYQGDVWYNGEKLGFWAQDGNGAICDTFRFNKHILLPALDKHQERTKQIYASTECLMTAVVSHIQDYKQYKSMLKKGAKSMIVITDYYNMYVTCIGATMTDIREIQSKYYTEIEKYKEKYTQPNLPAIVKIYTCEEDFIID